MSDPNMLVLYKTNFVYAHTYSVYIHVLAWVFVYVRCNLIF